MGISVELFRIRIGTFNTNGPRKMKYESRDLILDTRKTKIIKTALLIFSILLFHLSVDYAMVQDNAYHVFKDNCIKAANKVKVKSEIFCREKATFYFDHYS